MPKKPQLSEEFVLRPHDSEGAWESNDGRYRRYAQELLVEHKNLCDDVLRLWPASAGPVIRDPKSFPEVAAVAKRRNQTSDTACVYAAMAVEGYLNFYGVLRLGQDVFDEHIERMGLVPKLRALLLFCDQLKVAKNAPIVQILEKLAKRRNSLVHPKTIEVRGDPAMHESTALPMPQTAIDAIDLMEAFFAEFVRLVPMASNHLSRMPDA